MEDRRWIGGGQDPGRMSQGSCTDRMEQSEPIPDRLEETLIPGITDLWQQGARKSYSVNFDIV